MEFEDDQIKQYNKPKRSRRPSSPSHNKEQIIPSSSAITTTTPSKNTKYNCATKSISSIRKRPITGLPSKAFQSPIHAQPFQSPLLNRTASIEPERSHLR